MHMRHICQAEPPHASSMGNVQVAALSRRVMVLPVVLCDSPWFAPPGALQGKSRAEYGCYAANLGWQSLPIVDARLYPEEGEPACFAWQFKPLSCADKVRIVPHLIQNGCLLAVACDLAWSFWSCLRSAAEWCQCNFCRWCTWHLRWNGRVVCTAHISGGSINHDVACTITWLLRGTR